MSSPYSLLTTKDLSKEKILHLFSRASLFKSEFKKSNQFLQKNFESLNKTLAFVFFENSTRTRMSFQMAAYRLGLKVISMDSITNSSITKGESQLDTILNIDAMKPDLFVIRCGDSFNLKEIAPQLSVPTINAGSGATAHPTQALLDCFTLYETRRPMSQFRVLIVGDVRYSRVASSNFNLLQQMGAEVGVCGPESLMPDQEKFPHVKVFKKLDEGLDWANVCMILRIQLERHDAGSLKLPSLSSYHEIFGVTPERLKAFDSDGIIMHPGPINHGVELSTETLKDPRCVVLNQVENGVYTRAALMEDIILSSNNGGNLG